MLRLSVRQVLAKPLRLVLTFLAVALGVSFISGSLVLTETSQQLFDEQFGVATGGSDITVRSAAAFGSAMGVEVERDPLPSDLAGRVAAVPGVERAVPVVEGQSLLEFRGEPIVPQGASILTSWSGTAGAYTVQKGREPRADGEVMIDSATATDAGITLGDSVRILAGSRPALTVVGLAGFGDADGVPNSTVAITTLPVAQDLLEVGNDVTDVLVAASPDTRTQELQRNLITELGAGFEVVSNQDLASASAEAAKENLGYLQVALLAMAGASLLISAFLIANTFSIVITQRTRELAILRAAGATGRQVTASVLAEAALIGVTASLAGVGLGLGMSLLLRDLVSAAGMPLPQGPLVISFTTVAVALATGVVVSVLSALAPARMAAGVSPVTALRDSSAERPRIRRIRLAVGGVLLALGIGSLLTVVAGAPELTIAGGAILIVIGVVLVGPAVVPGLARLLGAPLRALGPAERMGSEGLAQSPRRTTKTVVSLALSLAVVVFVLLVGSSITGAIRETFHETITADLTIESTRGEMLGGLPMEVHHHVSESDSVAVASRLQYGHWKDGEVVRALTAVDPDTIGDVTDVQMTEGRLQDLGLGEILLAEHLAADERLAVGDAFEMTFANTGEQHLTVAGFVSDADAQVLSTDYIVSLDTYDEHFAEHVDANVFVGLADGVVVADAKEEIEELLSEFPTAEVRDQDAAASGRATMVEQIIGLATVLLMLAVAIGLMGIANTLALSVSERKREIGLLRAVGMTRGQLRRMLRAEAMLMALLAVVVGLLLGGALALTTVSALSRSTPITLEVPLAALALLAGGTVLAGLVAGVAPARRAARLDVLDAIAER
ncbi:ABC transporter permease [Lysobacter korlensis]|uniref:ABC transporter permease n=1 Tax=Lysobacter korlensis TaxID=553636 RepID=A0ABV6S065_9GAMM